jgi:uroporphyrinogen decarboxylase
MVEHPLANCTSVSELESYAWPDPVDDSRFEGLEYEGKAFRETPFANVGRGHIGAGVFEESWWLNGMQKYLEDLLLNPGYAIAVAEKVTELKLACIEKFLDKVGEYIDIYTMTDDWCGQDGPIISPELIRKIFVPLTKRIIDLIKRKSNAKVFLHSCGSVIDFIPDIIEMGVDILNPVQVRAKGMDPIKLKREYGKDLVFWGGVDTQQLLPFGTPEEVSEQCKRLIDALAPGGGFVFNTSHNIQSGTPPENLLAMYRTAVDFGAY